MSVTIQIRRDTAANWTSVNPVLHDGELGYEKDTGKAKVGNGTTAWNSLSYWSPGSGAVTSVNGHTGTVVLTNTDVGADASGAAATAQTNAQNFASATFIPLTQRAAANGVATLDSGTKVPAAQIPALSQYAPIGLTGAQAATSYAGGTVSGHPLSGTWSAGQWVVDQTGKIYVCVTGGTPGTWRRVGKDPWQFFIDDYATGDGIQALVSVSNGSATINTTPLSAPAAPTMNQATTGGTVAAGVYQGIITFVNRWGETVGSSSASVTTTTATSTITVSSPTPTGNATGWYLYLTQAGGSTYTRQQAAGSPTRVGASYTLTAPPTNTGAAPPGADTSAAQVFTSTAVDGGKNIMICGAIGLASPLIDTIATVVSPTQATLATTTASVTQAGCAMVFSSDVRTAIDQCISDAEAYALTHDMFCQVIAGASIYGLGTGFFTKKITVDGYQCNTQLRIPVALESTQRSKLEFQLLGPGQSSHSQYWNSQLVDMTGACFVSYSMGPTTADPTYGQQSVIGGPTAMPSTGLLGSGFADVKAVIDGIMVIQPGWSNSISFDLTWIPGCYFRGSTYPFAPDTNNGGGINPSFGWLSNSFWQGKLGIGLRLPANGNNDDVIVESFAVNGITTGVVSGGDHVIFRRLVTITCDQPFKFVSEVGPGGSHDLTIQQWSYENCNSGIQTDGAPAYVKCHIVMDGENSSVTGCDIRDAGNGFHGVIFWSDTFRSGQAPVISGCQNVRIVNGNLGPGIVPPVVPLTFGTTLNINASLGNVFTVTLTASTGTFAAPTLPQDGQVIRIRITQDATGGRTVAWNSAFDWGHGNSAPTLSTTANVTDVLGFEYNAATSKWMYLNAAFPQGF